jgi:hypothetical protein
VDPPFAGSDLFSGGIFMRIQQYLLGAAALGLFSSQALAAQAVPPAPKPAGSAYLQCDGQPNNMTDGELAARLIGAVTLLGLFAKPPESPDASKRLFGAAGVAACTSLLEGDRKEGNVNRRIGLMLGRALHHVEAKNYDSALADVATARREAEAAGLFQNIHWARSRGRSFDQVEAAILFRQGKPAEAQAVSLRSAGEQAHSLFGLISLDTYSDFLPKVSDAEDRTAMAVGRLLWVAGGTRADRLEQAGRFAEAASARDALVDFDAVHSPEVNISTLLAASALSHALAGNWDRASERAKAARANSESRKAAGKPESDAAELVELLDLYGIVETTHKGDLKTARRLFSARSEWVAPSFGASAEVNRRLRQGAAADELIGGLAKTPEQLWAERVEAKKAALLAKDSDNKTLFGHLSAAKTAGSYHSLSKNVWNVEKSRIILKRKPTDKSQFDLMLLFSADPDIAFEAYLLHAALASKARGAEGFVFQPIITDRIFAASFRPGKKGDKGFAPELFIEADQVIAALRPLFPDPQTLKAAAKK